MILVFWKNSVSVVISVIIMLEVKRLNLEMLILMLFIIDWIGLLMMFRLMGCILLLNSKGFSFLRKKVRLMVVMKSVMGGWLISLCKMKCLVVRLIRIIIMKVLMMVVYIGMFFFIRFIIVSVVKYIIVFWVKLNMLEVL